MSGEFADDMELLGFSHSAVGVVEALWAPSSCSRPHVLLRPGVLVTLMLSPFPYSESVKSKDAFATSPSGFFFVAVVSLAFGRISGSNVEF